LDGNGYTIKVKSFDFDSIRGSEQEKDAGLFTSIATGTVVKNLVLDVSELLVTEEEMLANLEQSKQDVDRFDASNYRSTYAIDLSFMAEIHFGMLAGTNKGSVTNVKLINTKNTDTHEKYLHIVTSQAFINGKITHSSIGGLVGVNEGAVSNSYVGLNYSTLEASDKSYIEMIVSPSGLTYSNVEDELGEVETYPFIIAGGNVLAGIVSDNKGILSNSYVKGIGLYNTFPIVEYSKTGGVVSNNKAEGYVSSCFIEGYNIANYRASTTDDYYIESTGNIGGFVYSNEGTFENAYSNISLQTRSAYTGGFVYTNTETGVVSYAYSTAVSRQSKAHGQFTGVYVNDVQNKGLYTSCFYLVAVENETPNVREPATAIETYSIYSQDNSVGYAFSDVDTWNGFAFVSGNNNDSIWTMPDINSTSTSSDLRGPQINASLIDTVSFRRLANREDIFVTDSSGNIVLDENGDWVIKSTEYEYEYNTYSLGSRENPLIIDTAENFVKYIIDNTDIYSYNTYDYVSNNVSGDYVKINNEYILDTDRLYPLHDRFSRIEKINSLHVFGAGSLANVGNNSIISNINDVQYVRLINNLDFSKEQNANAYKDVHLYDIVFAGSLDGNGMTMSSLNLSLDNMEGDLENFGLFSQIGLSEQDITNITGVSGITSELQSAVKNVKITVKTYSSSNASKAGILAGTINNASIVNVQISGETPEVHIDSLNMAGALAGLIYSDNNYIKNDDYASASNYSIVRLIDIKVSNIKVSAHHLSLGGTLSESSTVIDQSYYSKFNIYTIGNLTEIKEFKSLFNRETNTTDLSRTNQVSYAGMVAGVISVNNYVRQVGYHGEDDVIEEYDRFTYYRTTPSETVIRNIVVSDSCIIEAADNAGGLFGYVGENTHIKESQFIVGGNSQLIKGNNYVGGIVGENHGILEQVYVAYEDKAQDEIDATIYDPNRTVSGDYLFGLVNEVSYTVSVGGIAGYSKNGVIIDAYSKVNVVKNNAYIAGGLVGYAEDYNYIAFSYTTGAVYSSRVVGGLIGFYKYTMLESGNEIDGYTYGINEKQFLYMKSVVALTHWNYSEGDVDVRASIGTALYNDYKTLYRTGASGYYDFDITMPEIGNQKVKSYLNVSYYADTGLYNLVDTIGADAYYSSHSNKYVGSAIGRVLYHTVDKFGDAVPSDREQIDFIHKEKLFIDINNYINTNMYTPGNDVDYDIKNLKAKYFAGVYTDTYGAYSASGSTENGNKDDSYDSGGFSIVSGTETKSLISFKTVGSGYRYTTADAFNNLQLENVKGDVLFNKIFTAQEYLQQIIGYYGSMSDGGTGENLYRNLFSNSYYSKNRYEVNLDNVNDVDWINGAYTNGAQENDYTSNIWAVNTYIPTKSFGIYGNIKYVSNSQELIDVFNDANNNMTYYIQPQEGNAPYIINVNAGGENYNLYRFKNTFTGALRSLDSDEKIKIIINYGSDGNNAVSLFRELNSASFYNISFVLNINNSVDITADKYGYMGMFANRVISTQFQNCEFTINVNMSDNLLTVGTPGVRTADYFGGLFGYVSGVNIYSASVKVNDALDSVVSVNDEGLNLKSFSFVMGFVTNCVMSNLSFSAIHNGNDENQGLTLEYYNVVDMTDVVVGGVMAYCKNSTIEFTKDNYNAGISITFTSDALLDAVNVGGIFGNATYTKIKNPIYNGNLDIVRASDKAEVAVGGIIGYALYDTLYNAKVSMEDADSIKINGNYKIKLSNTMGSSPKSSVVTKLALGGIVGYNAAGTVIGEIGAVEENTVNNADIEVIIGSNTSNDVNNVSSISVGGLVGYSATSSSLLNRAINTGNITIEDYSNYYIKTENYISVGGLVGRAEGIIGINYIYNAGNIISKFAKMVEKMYIGGLVGSASQNINITYFANYGDFNGGFNTTVDGNDAVVGGYATYVGGIVGYNVVTSALKYGYNFGEMFNYNKSVVVSSIAGGNIDSESINVYYVQEFIKNNYDTDSVFIPVVYADLYDTSVLGSREIDKERHTEIDDLTKYGFSAIKEGRVFVYTINGLISPFTNGFKKIESRISDLSSADGSKYNPLLVSSTNNTDVFGAYNVVLLNMEWDNTKDVVIGEDIIISGKTQKDKSGNLMTTVMSLLDNKHPFVTENNGVISNLTIYRSEETDENYAYEGDFAYGVIENYGVLYKVNAVVVSHTSGTESTSALVSYNEGNIIASGAIVLQKYLYDSPSESVFTSYSAFVWTNAGYISDCYSTSYLYGDIKDGVQDLNYNQYVYGLVASNGYVNEDGELLEGVIKYSYHYMKGVGEEDSDTKLYINEGVENYKLIGASVGADSLELYIRDKVEIKVLPTWISARNVWVSNLDTEDNYGYPYIKNTYITGTVVVSSVDISTIIKNNLYSNDEFTSDDLSIQYSFFKNMNDENSIIVSTPAKFYSILASAANSTLSNQIILITKDLDMTGYELTQVISYNYATIVGAVLVGNTYRNAVISNLTIKGGSMFGTNYGIMAFIDYKNLMVTGDTYVASICVHNKGTISHVNISDSYIYGNSYVGGIASYNSVPSNISSNVGIYYVSLSNVQIYNGSSSGYTGGIAAVNEGSTTRNYTHGIIDSSVVGLQIYSLGSYAGGIVGRNYGKITDVIVRGYGSGNRLTITVSGGSYVGGIAGYTTVEITGN
ncbi:MAG: hypothetical protein IJW28_04635, partial [Clostridia bacterium]|nr:hypothetical protein [Clostridia bacterium]